MSEIEEFEFRDRLEKESESSILEDIAGHPAYRAVSAVGEPLLGIAELGARKLIDPITGVAGLGHPVGDYLSESIDQRNELIEKGRKARGDTGIDVPRLAGSIVAPVGVASKVKAGATLGSKMLGGATLGSATAMTMPVGGDSEGYDEKKVEQGAVGALFGGALPPIASAFKGAGSIIDEVTKPLAFRNTNGIYRKVTDSLMDANEKMGGRVIPKDERTGIYQDVKGFINNQSGENKAKIVRALQGADKGQTTGQAIAKANNLVDDVFGGWAVKLEQDLAKDSKSGDALKKIYKSQIGKEKGVLNKLSGTDEALDTAINVANKQANKGYGAVTGNKISNLSDKQKVANAIEKARGKATNSEASKGEALRDWGRFKTLESQQNKLANNRIQPEGMPRVPPRYAPHAPTVKQAGLAADDASVIAKQRLVEEQTHRGIMDSFIKNQLGTDSRSFGDFFSRPSVIAGMKEAKKSAAETGSYFPSKPGDEFTVGNLQRIKRAISEKITTEAREGSIGKTTEKEMNDTLKSFVGLLRKKSPGFAKTEDEFIANMKPVNSMKVGRELRKDYSNNTDGLTGGKFITSAQNPKRTVKRATGFRGAKDLPEGFDETKEIVSAIQNRAQAKEMARNTKSVLNELTGEVEITLPNMLSRPVLLTNAALKMISKDKTPEYKAILSKAYTEPKKFERFLTEAPKSNNRVMAEDILKKLTVIGAGSESGRSVGEN